MAVQGVLPVQQAIQGQCATDVVQGKDAVGIPCKERSIPGVSGAQDRRTWGWDHGSSWVLRMGQSLNMEAGLKRMERALECTGGHGRTWKCIRGHGSAWEDTGGHGDARPQALAIVLPWLAGCSCDLPVQPKSPPKTGLLTTLPQGPWPVLTRNSKHAPEERLLPAHLALHLP